MIGKKDDSLERFIKITKEYKRFVDYFHGLKDRVDEVSKEDDYISLNTRLILLRKYGFSGDMDFKSILKKAGKRFPEHKNEFEKIRSRYNSIGSDYESILPDGTSLGLIDVINDVLNGIYLHTDRDKIGHINQSEDELIFAATQHYVLTLERIVMDAYDILNSCMGCQELSKEEKKRSHIIFLGDKNAATHSVTMSPYWSNVYGRDADIEDRKRVINENSVEDNWILLFCVAFLDELRKADYSANKLQLYVFPPTRKDWGDFSAAHNEIIKHEKIGFSSKVRYNNKRDMAYVLVLKNVDGEFIIDQPHVSTDISVITLVKENERYGWRVYCLGQKLDHYKETLNLRDSIKRLIKELREMLIRNRTFEKTDVKKKRKHKKIVRIP